MKYLPILLLTSSLLLTACAAHQERVKGSVKVVEASSSSKPDWLEERSLERDGNLFFVGTVNNVRDLSLGEEQAEFLAKRTIASAIRETFQREFSTALTGSNRMDDGRLGQAIESALSASTERVQVRGAMPAKRYWERVEMATDDGVVTGYNVALLVRISKVDFERAKSQVYNDLAQAEQLKADAQAKDLLKRVRGNLMQP